MQRGVDNDMKICDNLNRQTDVIVCDFVYRNINNCAKPT